jgi:radical SAM superfamily enzyme YgiQ (UPF0313 family)
MKIFLFNPLYSFPLDGKREKYYIRSGSRWPHSGIKRKGSLPHYLPFPFFLAYAAAWLRKEGFEVVTCDCVALDMPLNGLLALMEQERPDVLFFETATPTINLDTDLAGKIKQRLGSSLLILGGPHSSVYPGELLSKSAEIDFVLIGEYEESLVELCRALRDKLPVPAVKGVAYRDEGVAKLTGPRGLIDPLDKLPEPAYDMFPSSSQPDPGIYWDGFCQHRPALQMHASRGCPYRCNFCLWNQVMYGGGKYRTFPPGRVAAEMVLLAARYGAREIYFDDDDFTINRAHVEAICRALLSSGARLKWSCMGDAINLSEDLVALMARSGCVGIKFGVETGSPRMLKDLGKPVDLDRVKDVARWCAAHKIKTHATFSLGLLNEDAQSAEETLSYLEGLDVDTIQVSICTPSPGTKFFEYAEKEGLLKTRDWEKYDGKASEVIRHRHLDLEKAEAMRSRAMKRWLLKRLLSPAWVARQMRYFLRVLRGLGPSFLLGQALSLLREEKVLSSGGD